MDSLAERFAEHGLACERMGAPLYARLMSVMADDIRAGGPVAEVCAGWESSPAEDVVQLRLLAALYRRVLSGREPGLAAYYPNVGGWLDIRGVWPAARRVLVEDLPRIRSELSSPPQTNEVGRAAALLVGLSDVVNRIGRHRVRLLEVGASGGLNLQVDRFHHSGTGWEWGAADSPVRLHGLVRGTFVPAEFELVERRGCDLRPVDPRSEEGWLRLRSFCWPDHHDRDARLLQALSMTGRSGWTVDQAAAAPWLHQMLTEQDPLDQDPSTVSVVWHSVVTQYMDQDERQRVQDAIVAASGTRPVAHVRLEPGRRGLHEFELRSSVYTDGAGDDRHLADVGPHGDPVEMVA